MLIYYVDEIGYDYGLHERVNNYANTACWDVMYGGHTLFDVDKIITYIEDLNVGMFTALGPVTKLSVDYGDENSIDKQFCIDNHIQFLHEERQGGPIIMFPGNIALHSIRKGNTFSFYYDFMEDFAKWLCDKGLNASTNRNDLIVDNKKVAGSIIQIFPNHKEMVYFGIVVSINVDVELIDHVCKKPMIKIPGALSDYGITTEEVMDWLLEWFDKH